MEKQDTVFTLIICFMLGVSIYIVWVPLGFMMWLETLGIFLAIIYGLSQIFRILQYMTRSRQTTVQTLRSQDSTPVIHCWVGHPFADLEEVANKMNEIQSGIRLLDKDLNQVATLLYFGWTIIRVEMTDLGRQDFYMRRREEAMRLSFVDINTG